MQSEQSSNSWLSNGQLTPTSTTRAYHRESSLSSLGSAEPASPYTANTSTPHVAGEYHDFLDFQQTSSKPPTPEHTLSQEHFPTPHYSNLYQNSTFPSGCQTTCYSELIPTPGFTHSARPSIASVVNHDSPSTPPSYEEERQNNGETSSVDFCSNEYLQLCDSKGYRNTMPQLDRTMTDIYADELYNPSFQITSALPASTAPTVTILPQNDVIFTQRLHAANSQHLNANTETPLAISSREQTPFRQASPLAPTSNNFASQSKNVRLGTATHIREQLKAESDARALQQLLERTSPEQVTPKTISPKEIYPESEEDANIPHFTPQQHQCQSPKDPQQTTVTQEPFESDGNASQPSYGSIATTRRESSSTYSSTSQATVLQPTPVAAQCTPPRKIKQSDITRPKSAKSRNEGQKKSQNPNASSQNERRARSQSAGVPKQTSNRKRRPRSKSFLAKIQERSHQEQSKIPAPWI
jgi:protein RPN4